MKKYLGFVGAFILGAVVMAAGEDVSAKVKSLVGQKVAGEYNVVVNGKELEQKGAVIAGTTNIPVRAVSEALGADLKVEDKTIYVTLDNNKVVEMDGKYYSKYDLLNEQKKTTDLLTHLNSRVEQEEAKTESMSSQTGIVKQLWEDGLKDLREKVAQNNQKLNDINEALKAFE
ncbi:stalk domain-containing protein [Paenibacillus glucanolyticus]|uniref:stalk domain-containing protein n=1 Tax=Paenibacillus glucanolyticus TaxID=59843 RepID=UPI00096E16A8|nr:stalk domain-containing protein [Paenibacillus glucanolyticus]OMF70519.1 hypothetical protein BK142_23890 [Paenibacillus glucanolyticus]